MNAIWTRRGTVWTWRQLCKTNQHVCSSPIHLTQVNVERGNTASFPFLCVFKWFAFFSLFLFSKTSINTKISIWTIAGRKGDPNWPQFEKSPQSQRSKRVSVSFSYEAYQPGNVRSQHFISFRKALTEWIKIVVKIPQFTPKCSPDVSPVGERFLLQIGALILPLSLGPGGILEFSLGFLHLSLTFQFKHPLHNFDLREKFLYGILESCFWRRTEVDKIWRKEKRNL